ncbi:MAG: tetratricopeptide repeat protein [Ruminococcus sp.]|nr:tetratricopeptide repeat protein [Ruminococcus sp.]
MFLKSLRIKNFKGFENIKVKFDNKINLIIGNNGMGKTSVLEAVIISLGGFICGIDGVKGKNITDITEDNIRIEMHKTGEGSIETIYKLPVEICADIDINGKAFEFCRKRISRDNTYTITEPEDVQSTASEMAGDLGSILPVVSYQSFKRLSEQGKNKNNWINPFSENNFPRIVGYDDCFSQESNTLQMTEWIKRMEYISWQNDKEAVEYSAVKKAVNSFMSKMMDNQDINIFYDKRAEEIMYSSDNETLPIRMLSSGYRSLIGMVIDIATRMAVLNPDLKNDIIKQTPGIILIDEIDLHLHPEWQWKVLSVLSETFPNVQIIATTHSPIIIASCDKNNVITIQQDDSINSSSANGWQISDVLKTYMNTASRSSATLDKLKKLKSLADLKYDDVITDEELTEYNNIISELSAILPESDIVIEETTMSLVREKLLSKQDSNDDQAKYLLENSKNYYEKVDYSTALRYALKALEVFKSTHSDKTADIFEYCFQISDCYYALGDYDKFIEYMTHALDLAKDNSGVNSDILFKIYNQLGESYLQKFDCNISLEYFKKALIIAQTESENNPNHPALATSYNNLGNVCYYKGAYDKAIEYYNKALGIKKIAYKDNSNHPDLAIDYNNLGTAYNSKGEYDKAIEYYNEALEIYEIAFKDNPNRPYLAASYNNLGNAYQNKGEYDKAIEYYNKALKIVEIAFKDNPNHPYLAASYNNLGSAYGNKGEYDKAIEYYSKALDIRKIAYKNNPNHPYLAESYNNIGVAYQNKGDHNKAIEYYSKALDIRRIAYKDNPNHPDLVTSYNNLGIAFQDKGEYNKAIKYFSKALEIYQKISPINNTKVLFVYKELVASYVKLGDFEHASKYIAEIEKIEKTTKD